MQSRTEDNLRRGILTSAAVALLGLAIATSIGACGPADSSDSDDGNAALEQSGASDGPDVAGEVDEASDSSEEGSAPETDGGAGGDGGEEDAAEADTDSGDAADVGGTLVVYSGRSESLVGPLVERFESDTGIEVDVRWGNTVEMAGTLLEEGDRSPADVFFAQDPGGLGAVIEMLGELPTAALEAVPLRFRDPGGRWVGVSGRARVVVYNTENVATDELPDSLDDLLDPSWRGRIGWAPGNASLQTMITAMRHEWGDDRTEEWLEGLVANEPVVFDGNTPIVAAAGAGDIDVGLVNHYYLYRFLAEEGDSFPARNHHLPNGGPGSLVMVAGTGILKTAPNRAAAEAFVEYLLSQSAQTYFAEETFEYPLAAGVPPSVELPPLEDLPAPQIELQSLADIQGSVQLLQAVGALP